MVRGRVELPTFRFSAVPSCAGECRFVRGDSVGNYAADPDLWGFCGATTRSSTRFPSHQEHLGNANGAARRAGPDRGASFSAAASSCGAIMLSRTTGTCASCYRRHARHLDEQQPGHRPAAPAHPGEALTTDPADAGQHPEHPLPPTRASLQQRVTTPGMPRTDSTRRTPNRRGSVLRSLLGPSRAERGVMAQCWPRGPGHRARQACPAERLAGRHRRRVTGLPSAGNPVSP